MMATCICPGGYLLFISVVIQASRDLLKENADLVMLAVKTGKQAVAAEIAKHDKSA